MKLSESLTEFKSFKSRGFDFKTVLAVLVSMVVSPEKTVHSYLNSATGEGSMMGKDSYSTKRGEDLDSDKIGMVLRMFYSPIYRGLRVDYVLVDSWFTCC